MRKAFVVSAGVLVIAGVCLDATGGIWFHAPYEKWFSVGLPLMTAGQCCLILAIAVLVIALIVRGDGE